MLQQQLDEATDQWGVKVEKVLIKDVRIPRDLQRSMAAEAEANREAKAKVRYNVETKQENYHSCNHSNINSTHH